ncbi:MAG: hypothetical protein JNL32_08325, partial [Candidatus Kapabacteria bacterium]|nr:hypothetical protein [Candidatus Kapabacteria bacterium]
SSYAQINNPTASATININVAQNAQVGFLSFNGSGAVTLPGAYIASPIATQTAGTTLWLTVGQSKSLVANSLAPVFVVQGERGAQITANVSASLNNTNVTLNTATWSKSVDGSTWSGYSNGNNTLSDASGVTTIGPTAGQLGQFLLRYDVNVVGAGSGTGQTSQLTASVTINSYSI